MISTPIKKQRMLTRFQFRLSALAIGILCATMGPAQAEVVADGRLQVAVSPIPQTGLRGQLQNGQNSFLQGAQVRVLGTNRETSTDREGRFRFDGLTPGVYQLEISYLGYGRHQLSVELSAEQGTLLQVRLQRDDTEVMQVLGSRSGQSRALNMQRASDNIKSVISADVLGRFPDNNVAESVQRLPGASIQRDQGEGRYVNVRGAPVEFANVTLNGMSLPSPDSGTRAIELDTIPADVIATLELTKALTPAMDADAIAGTINIVTQGALDSPERIARYQLAAGKNQLGNGDLYRGGLTLGSRFGSQQQAGVLISASHSTTERVTNNIEHDWTVLPDGRFLVDETVFKDYQLTRTRNGLSARLDWRPAPEHHLYLLHNHSRFKDDEYRDALVISLERFDDDANAVQGEAGRATFEKELRHRTVVNTIDATQFGGHSVFERFNLNYHASWSKATQTYPNRDYLLYRANERPALHYDFSDTDLPSYQLIQDGSVQAVNRFDLLGDDWGFRRYERRFGASEEKEQSYGLDLEVPLNWGQAYSTLSFGLKARLKDKRNDEDRFRNSNASLAPGYADVARTEQSLPFGGRYHNGAKLERDFVALYGAALEGMDYQQRIEASLVNDYQVSEDIYAVYAMNTLEWEQLTLLYGVRLEHSYTRGEAVRFDSETEEAELQQASRRQQQLFPSVHLRYELDSGLVLRSAFSTGLNRPNFEELVPYLVIEERGVSGGRLSQGNMSVKPAYAYNLDAMAEYYMEPLGLVSAGLFYKHIRQPIFTARSLITEGDFSGFIATQQENGRSGYLLGLELNWQQQLTALPGVGLLANLTLTDSAARLPDSDVKTRLPGTSRTSYNLALSYDRGAFSSQLAYNYRSEFIDSLNTLQPDFSIWWDGRATLDGSVSYRLMPKLTAYVEASNLTNSKAVRFQGDRSRVYEHEQFGRTWLLGVRGQF